MLFDTCELYFLCISVVFIFYILIFIVLPCNAVQVLAIYFLFALGIMALLENRLYFSYTSLDYNTDKK